MIVFCVGSEVSRTDNGREDEMMGYSALYKHREDPVVSPELSPLLARGSDFLRATIAMFSPSQVILILRSPYSA